MFTKKSKARDKSKLRQSAEERLKKSPSGLRKKIKKGLFDDELRLLHELEVHQIELEIQNEELQESREKAEAERRRFTEIFEFAPLGYFVLAADGTICEVNHAGARLLDLERLNLKGRKFGLFVVEDQRENFNAFLFGVIDQQEEWQGGEGCELALEREGGDIIEASITASRLDSHAPMVLVAVENITARKRAEAQLREENRNKEEFMSVLSHELRNPLAPIVTSLMLLDRLDIGGKEAKTILDVIHRQVSHLTRIVDDLLDITRISRGKIPLKKNPVELSEITARSFDDHRPTFELKGVELLSQLHDENFWVNGDSTRLRQVLGNVLGNALKFTSRGGRVEVKLSKESSWATLSICDTGEGMSPEVIEKAFQPFSQAPQSLDRPQGGLGLGLAMVKGLVDLHDGMVKVHSKGIGLGTEVTIRLPLVESIELTRANNPWMPPARCKVLVVEDNMDTAQTLRDLLSIAGYRVEVANDGQQGLELARLFRPQIILCDIGLPGMDGYDFARSIREDRVLRDSFLVALSGYAHSADIHRASAAGFDRHLAKPSSFEELERVFAEAGARN